LSQTAAMAHGMEAVWDKELGYVTREPYRSLLVAKVAHLRFCRAISKGHMTRREALAMLALARATSPGKITPLVYAAGWAAIVLPGGTQGLSHHNPVHSGRVTTSPFTILESISSPKKNWVTSRASSREVNK